MILVKIAGGCFGSTVLQRAVQADSDDARPHRATRHDGAVPELVAPVIEPGGLSRIAQPTLTFDELVLRPWETSDAARVAAAYDDPDIERWHVKTMTPADALDAVSAWSRGWTDETGAFWAIADDSGLVGRVGFKILDLAQGGGHVTYWVLPAARGRNIAARALTVATSWMFELAGFHRMTLLHSTRNLASCRVADRAAYQLEGTARLHGLHADGWHDMHMHARVHESPGCPTSAA